MARAGSLLTRAFTFTHPHIQLNYLLGDCCGGNSSFVVGFSNNRNDTTWPRSYHHRAASCNGDKCSCTACK